MTAHSRVAPLHSRRRRERERLIGIDVMRSIEPSILYLCANCPYGETYGASIRARLVAEGLRLAGAVTIAPVSWYPWPESSVTSVRQYFSVTRQVLQEQQERRLSATLLRNMSAKWLNTDDRVVNPRDRAMIAEFANDADLVWVEDIGIANALGIWRWNRTVLDADDLLSRYHFARSRYEHGAKRLRTVWQSRRWKCREASFVKRFDRVVACSEDDRKYLGSHPRVCVIPNSFECSVARIRKAPAGSARFGFIGTLQWEPNRDAVRWFAREVMPIISRACPGAEFRIVGRDGVELLQKDALTGTALGYVDDPTDEMATWTAMVVPVRFGGGTRVKIADAFARGIPVVSTRTGAFGYEVAHRRELMLADSSQDFATACISVAGQPSLAVELIKSAANCLTDYYSPDSIRERVRRLACEVIGSAGERCSTASVRNNAQCRSNDSEATVRKAAGCPSCTNGPVAKVR
jgi:Glycosyl transferases group 1